MSPAQQDPKDYGESRVPQEQMDKPACPAYLDEMATTATLEPQASLAFLGPLEVLDTRVRLDNEVMWEP